MIPSTQDLVIRKMLKITRDEQTVNACVVTLIIAVARILGSSGRVHLERECFQVLKKHVNDDNALYEAQVDELIMEQTRKDIVTFMEAKRDLRLSKRNVRMQEGAEMAAFVYSKVRTTEAKRYDEEYAHWRRCSVRKQRLETTFKTLPRDLQ